MKKEYRNLSRHRWSAVNTIGAHLCDSNLFNSNEPDTLEMEFEFDTLLETLAPKNFVGGCSIYGQFYDDCMPFFNKILTTHGICFAFNQFPVENILTENAYDLESIKAIITSESNYLLVIITAQCISNK